MKPPRSRLQVRTHRLGLVENKAVVLVVCTADFLEVFENTVFELVQVLDADALHVDCGFFAAMPPLENQTTVLPA